jgi:hypothetical protein
MVDQYTIDTDSNRAPWEELWTKYSTVPASKIAQAAEIVRGLKGSWTYQVKEQSVIENDSTKTSDVLYKSLKLGYPGFPELDFAPYAYGTNRFANKGGSLIGAPISFQVVGPTYKSGLRDTAVQGRGVYWQWVYTTEVLGGETRELLSLDNVKYDLDGTLDGTAFAANSLSSLYGFTAAEFDTRFDGGLYLVVTHTGNPPDPAAVGVGDGTVMSFPPFDLRTPVAALTETSKFEIFRVDSYRVTDNSLILGLGKSFSDYFDVSNGTPTIAAIMLIEPAATRLVAIPDTGNGIGQEQMFMFVPPERALHADYKPEYSSVILANYTGSGLESSNAVNTAATILTGFDSIKFEYNYGSALPLPKQVGEGSDTLSLSTASEEGWARFVLSTTPQNNIDANLLKGRVLHIYSAEVADGDLVGPYKEAGLGWFEIMDLYDDTIHLRRMDEWQPSTGLAYWGKRFDFNDYTVKYTVHEPVSYLWRSTHFEADALEGGRLTNLIDPRWMQRTSLASPAKADRAIFNTRANSDPGSLLDLGFRVVLYPAKTKEIAIGDGLSTVSTVTKLVPDWDRPLDSLNCILDPSVAEPQYVEIDYANGVLRLSHAPARVGGDLSPTSLDVFSPPDGTWNGTTFNDNPRGSFVIFAACVPYTREESQTGGARITGGPAYLDEYAKLQFGECIPEGTVFPESPAPFDVYGARLYARAANNQTITYQSAYEAANQIIISGLWKDKIPASGIFEIRVDTLIGANPIADNAIFGYRGVLESGGNTVLYGLHGGGVSGGSQAIGATDKIAVIFRKELLYPVSDTSPIYPPYLQDTTYGDSARAKTLRLEDTELIHNVDGSISVKPLYKGLDYKIASITALLSEVFSNRVLSGGELSVAGAGPYTISYTDMVVLWEGQRKTILNGSLTDALASTVYIGVDDCTVGIYTDGIPLPNGIILLGSVTAAGAGTVDLRNPLTDLDLDVDIYVGRLDPADSSESIEPHFETLREALTFINGVNNPLDGASSWKWNIKVVGTTTEDVTSGSIPITAPGITISGNRDILLAINWTGTNSLFEVADTAQHLHVHDLYFICGTTHDDSPTFDQAVFYFPASGTTLKDIRITDCTSFGSQIFVYASAISLVGFECSRNTISETIDGGIYLTGAVLSNISICDNRILVWATGDVNIQPGIQLDPTDGYNITISRNIIDSSTLADHNLAYGIAIEGVQTLKNITIELNYLIRIGNYGIYMTNDTASSTDNIFIHQNIIVDPGSSATAGNDKRGIFCYQNISNVVIAHNSVRWNAETPIKFETYDILTSSDSHNVVLKDDNVCSYVLVEGDNCKIHDNTFEYLKVTGDNASIYSNTIELLHAGVSIDEDFLYIGALYYTVGGGSLPVVTQHGTGHIIKGNTFPQISHFGVVAGDVFAGSGCIITDNVIERYLFVRDNTTVSNNTIEYFSDHAYIDINKTPEMGGITGTANTSNVKVLGNTISYWGLGLTTIVLVGLTWDVKSTATVDLIDRSYCCYFSDSIVKGNTTTDKLGVAGVRNIISDNNADAGVWCVGGSIDGITKLFTYTGGFCTLTGNFIQGIYDVDHYTGTFYVYADFCTIQGNLGNIQTKGAGGSVAGVESYGILASLKTQNSIINGNTFDIIKLVSSDDVTDNTVIGNRFRAIRFYDESAAPTYYEDPTDASIGGGVAIHIIGNRILSDATYAFSDPWFEGVNPNQGTNGFNDESA